ncbi:MAG: hypothetical protein E7271_00845 [Lachnospiraceae bacterium]|nr:hypothetical protein [Lachnospiraceae bacterium]
MVVITILNIMFFNGMGCASGKTVEAADTITRGEWIHTLVTEMELSIDDGIYPDDYYPDITESEYYDDILIAINYGIINLEAGEDFEPDNAASREFVAHTLNCVIGKKIDSTTVVSDVDDLQYQDDDFVAIDEGWFELINGEFKPDRVITNDELASIVEYISDNKAILTDNQVTNFSIEYAENVIVLEETQTISIESLDDEKFKIVLGNLDSDINVGDEFVAFNEGFPCVYKALSVFEDGDYLVVNAELDENGIVSINASGSIEADYDSVEAADGVDISVVEEPVLQQSTRSLKKLGGSVSAKKSIHFETVVAGVKVTGEIKNIRADYQFSGLISNRVRNIVIKGDIYVAAEHNVKLSGSVPLGEVGIPGIGTIGLYINVDITGNIKASYSSNFQIGFKYSDRNGMNYIKKITKGDLDYQANIDAYIGLRAALKIGPNWGIPATPYGTLYADVGLKCYGHLHAFADMKKPDQCLDVGGYASAVIGYDFGFKKTNLKWNDSYVIWNKNNSPVRFAKHFEDGVVVNACSRGLKTSSGGKEIYITTPKSRTGKRTVSTYWDTGYVIDASSSGAGSGSNVVYKPAYDYTVDDDGNATITKYNGYAHYLAIPEYIDGHKVVAIGSQAFQKNTYIKSVSIPDGVATIGSSAFYQCSNLVSVDIPNSVTEINSRAFYGCSKLVDVDLPNKLVRIGGLVFYNTPITQITIPKSLEWAYDGIAEGPFNNCSELKTVKFETGVTRIVGYLFKNCNGLEEITIPDSVTTIGGDAFYQCDNLVSVDIPNSVTEINSRAFYGCSKLVDVDLPNKLVRIGGLVFYNTPITQITIPKSLEWAYDGIAEGPFNNCSELKTVKFETGVTRIVGYLFKNCNGLEEITIPDSVTTIGENAFYQCDNLVSVDIPNTVTSMGGSVFSNCTSLEKVHLPNVRVNVMDGTFSGCASLTEVNFPDTLETIGQSAFYNCTSLKEVNLPEKVNTINSSAFNGCTSLEKVTIPSSVKTIYGNAFSHCEALTDLTISEGVTTIYSNAFEYNKSLAKVTLPDSLQTLGEYAFRCCDVLGEVHLGAGLKTVPKYCFYEDPELVSVVLPQQITKVDEFAFGNCTKFTDVTMNRNVTSAAVNAFSYPAKLSIHGVSGTYAETFANDNNIKFTVLGASTTAIKLNKTTLELGRGYTAVLTAAITPEDSADQFTWTSTDEDVVTVDAAGKVKAVAGGQASIIAMSGDVIQICEVTVYEPVSSVYLDKSSYTGTTGEKLKLTATIYPSDATYKDIIWSSDNDKVASVDETGLVTLGSYGTAKITVTTKDMNRTSTCTITVKGIDVTGVTLNEKKTTIQLREKKKLIAIIAPENATNKNVTWISSNPAVATVDNGEVTGVSVGTTVIIVKTEDGAKTASCTVTVTEPTNLSADTMDASFDSVESSDATQTPAPSTITLYNNTDTDITDVSASMKNGDALSVQVSDTIAAGGSIAITITPRADLPVGVYEDEITIISSENTLVIPIRYEVKERKSEPEESSEECGGNGGNGNGTSNGNNTSNPSEKPGDVNPDAGGTASQDGSVSTPVIVPVVEKSAQGFAVGTEVDNTADKSKYKVLSNTTVEYTATINANGKQVLIPETVTLNGATYIVTEIAPNAFINCKKLKQVVVGKNITKIGKNAFSGCKNLKTITIKSTKLTKKSFGKNAFKGISKKATITVPKKQYKNYKKWIKAAGIPKGVKIKKK